MWKISWKWGWDGIWIGTRVDAGIGILRNTNIMLSMVFIPNYRILPGCNLGLSLPSLGFGQVLGFWI